MPLLDVTEFKQVIVPPKYPCPTCGKETKPHQTAGERICSDKNCRTVSDEPS